MNRFAALLDRLAYEPSRNNKLRLITDYLHATPDPEVRDAVFKLAHAGFAERRKQIANSMSSKLGWPRDQIDDLLDAAGIATSRRAETLTVPEWRRLAEELLSLEDGA